MAVLNVPRFILASRSPRRIELLRDAGFVFDIEPADVDESDVPPGLSPSALAELLATSKALAVAARHREAIVLGADTVVAIDNVTYGKAEKPDEARAMLIAQGGRRQDVFTGVCVCGPGGRHAVVERSVVEMRAMTAAELDTYLATDQWRGKAGAYGIQDHDPDGDPFVKLIEGEMTNVVGLPMNRVRRVLEDVGITPTAKVT